MLLNVIGFGKAGTNLLATSKDNLVASANVLEPTTGLLLKYSPTYTCSLQGTTFNLENGAYSAFGGGDGRTLNSMSACCPATTPTCIPTICRLSRPRAGPGGKPGCGSLPDVAKNFPVRQLVTNTGWGTGVDIRPNPGIGHPCYAELVTGDPRRAGAAQHPPVPSRAGDRAGAVSRSAAVRRAAVRARRGAAVAGRAAGRARPGAGEPGANGQTPP